jgi:hypothetical protein
MLTGRVHAWHDAATTGAVLAPLATLLKSTEPYTAAVPSTGWMQAVRSPAAVLAIDSRELCKE